MGLTQEERICLSFVNWKLEIWMDAPPEKRICVFSVASNFSAAALAFIPRTMGNIVLVKEDQ